MGCLLGQGIIGGSYRKQQEEAKEEEGFLMEKGTKPGKKSGGSM